MKKVLLLCQQGIPFEASPAECQLVHELKSDGYKTYVFNYGKIIYREIKCDIDYFVNTKNLSIREVQKRIRDIMPDFIIAFTDLDTRILSPLLMVMKKTAFIYYNLEIYTPEREQRRQKDKSFYSIKWRTIYFFGKLSEIIYTQACKLFIIQDELRKKTSKKYYVSHPNTMLIPNTYILHEEDNVEIESSGIVYAGLCTKNRLEMLVEKLHEMPNFQLTFSGWGDVWFKRQYRELHTTHPGIELFEQKLSPEEYSKFLKQYAVGLIWYSPSKDENEKNIGMSSGKLFKYLSVGKPVIVLEYPGVREIVDKYRLGIVIYDASELICAYKQIMKNYVYYKENVRRIYAEKFDYTKLIQPFLKKLKEL